MSLRSRPAVPAPILMLVTDRTRLLGRPHDGEEALDDVVREAAFGGVNAVQLREKDLGTARLVEIGLHVRDAIADRAMLFVNRDLVAARTLRAQGAHLPADGPTVSAARADIGDSVLVSRAAHSVEDAHAAEAEGADLIVAGTVFESASKPGGATLGVEGLRAICASVAIPVIAIGGITAANAADVIRARAAGVAVIGAIMDARDPRTAARALRDVIDPAWAAR